MPVFLCFIFQTRLVAGREKVVEHTIEGSILFIYLTNLIRVYEIVWICQLNENITVIHYFYSPPLSSHRKKNQITLLMTKLIYKWLLRLKLQNFGS